MRGDGGGTDDRWDSLLGAVDPVANLTALANVWREAAAASQRVVDGTIGENGSAAGDSDPTATGPTGPRDMRLDLERGVDQMADAAKRFLSQMSWPGVASPAPPPTPTVAVVDGVGTTEISVPGGDGELWSPGVVRHDGASIGPAAISFWATPTFGADGQACDEPPSRPFVVSVKVESDTPSGLYHGQIFCRGALGFVLPLEVKVVGADV